jgi:hypothetical protein
MEIRVDKEKAMDDGFFIQYIIDELRKKVKDKTINKLLDDLNEQVIKILDHINYHY